MFLCIIVAGCSDSSRQGAFVAGDDQTAKRPHSSPKSQVSDETPQASDKVESEIVRMVGHLAETTFDAKSLCDMIAQVPDVKMRDQYFKTLMDRAYSVRFEDIGDVPSDIECCDACDEGYCGECNSVCQCYAGALCKILKSFLTVVLPAENG